MVINEEYLPEGTPEDPDENPDEPEEPTPAYSCGHCDALFSRSIDKARHVGLEHGRKAKGKAAASAEDPEDALDGRTVELQEALGTAAPDMRPKQRQALLKTFDGHPEHFLQDRGRLSELCSDFGLNYRQTRLTLRLMLGDEQPEDSAPGGGKLLQTPDGRTYLQVGDRLVPVGGGVDEQTQERLDKLEALLTQAMSQPQEPQTDRVDELRQELAEMRHQWDLAERLRQERSEAVAEMRREVVAPLEEKAQRLESEIEEYRKSGVLKSEQQYALSVQGAPHLSTTYLGTTPRGPGLHGLRAGSGPGPQLQACGWARLVRRGEGGDVGEDAAAQHANR